MADEYSSLPWQWESPPADKGLVVLVDSTGRTLIYGVGSEPGWSRVPSLYVLAVTERAGAMEQALRRMVERAFPRIVHAVVEGELGRCIYCASIGGLVQARHYPECPVGPAAALLAEIDQARGAAR